jgi:hypothetical protein
VYLRFGKPVVLRQTAEGVLRVCGNTEQLIKYDELVGMRTRWTDVWRNGVYAMTQVRFAFSSEHPAAPVITYDSSADYGTTKFEQLQSFRDHIAAIVADRMAGDLQRYGRVEWTPKLAIRPDGLEITKKPSAAPEVVGFDRISQWKVDQGLFKLGIDESRRPVLTESTSEWNFYPGLVLFSRLCDAPSSETPLYDDMHVSVG